MTDGFETIPAMFGALDILMDRVGGIKTVSDEIREISVDDLRSGWQTETKGVFRAVIAARPDLVERDGTIMVTTSRQATQTRPDGLVQGVWFGRHELARNPARDLGPDGVHAVHALVDGCSDEPSLRDGALDHPDGT